MVAPCVTRTSATMELTIQEKQVLVFGKVEFQLPVAPFTNMDLL